MDGFNSGDRYSLLGAKPSLKRYWFAWALIHDGNLMKARRELEECLRMSNNENAPPSDKASAESVLLTVKIIDAILGSKS